MIRIGNILGLFGNAVAVLGNPIPPPPLPDASEGVVTYDGDYAIHTFSSSGDFIANKDLSINILVVAGGGAGGDANQIQNILQVVVEQEVFPIKKDIVFLQELMQLL